MMKNKSSYDDISFWDDRLFHQQPPAITLLPGQVMGESAWVQCFSFCLFVLLTHDSLHPGSQTQAEQLSQQKITAQVLAGGFCP